MEFRNGLHFTNKIFYTKAFKVFYTKTFIRSDGKPPSCLAILYMDKFYTLTALAAVHLARLIGATAAMLILSILLYLVEAL